MAIPKPLRFIIKRHSTMPYLELKVCQSNGDAFDFTGAIDVVFSMKNEEDVLVIDSLPAEFKDSDKTLGKLQYKWTPIDTSLSGDFSGEFDVRYPASEEMTLPIDGDIRIKIYDDINNQ